MKIPFNKPYITDNEVNYVNEVLHSRKLAGNGKYTQLCHDFFQNRYGFKRCLLTTSCTDALEMAAILINIVPGDEVIMPSYTFVSTANAFILRGANIIFADSYATHPCMDADKIEALITSKTKAIVPVHYGGIACDMDKIMQLANQYHLFVIEDAAQAINSYYIYPNGEKKALGSIGHFAAFSFHETKNIISGEGGMLVVNDKKFEKRAEMIWEKGTDRSAFFRSEVDKYGWRDIGSSFLPSEIIAGLLWAQLQHIDDIQNKRNQLWSAYQELFSEKNNALPLQLPFIPNYSTNNSHIFYLVCDSELERAKLIQSLKTAEILAVFHYISLHKSPYFTTKYNGETLENCERFSNCLLRLPLFYELSVKDVERIVALIQINCSK